MADQNENLLPGEQDTVMIYFNPELIQTLADRSAEKRQNFRELLSAAEDGLQTENVAKITDIVLSETSYTADQIKIMEAE